MAPASIKERFPEEPVSTGAPLATTWGDNRIGGGSLRVHIMGPSHGEHNSLLSRQGPKRGCTDPTLRSVWVIVRVVFPQTSNLKTDFFLCVCC